jgi:hypothetical protein
MTGKIAALSGFPKEQSETIASILYAAIEGLGLQKVADPDFKYDEAYSVLSGMLGAYCEQAMKRNPGEAEIQAGREIERE